MNYKKLIAAAITHLDRYPGYAAASGIATMFPAGARWMHARLAELDEGHIRRFDPGKNYNFYGCLKYGISLSACILSIWWFSRLQPLLAPISILIFYLFEVQFLFLFPLLLDETRIPIWIGIKKVFKIGLLRCILTVIPISIFMMVGLFKRNNVLRNWHVGCLAILIWYNNEIRTRV